MTNRRSFLYTNVSTQPTEKMPPSRVGLPTASVVLSVVDSVGGVRRKTSEKHPRCFNKGPPLPGGGRHCHVGREREIYSEKSKKEKIDVFCWHLQNKGIKKGSFETQKGRFI